MTAGGKVNVSPYITVAAHRKRTGRPTIVFDRHQLEVGGAHKAAFPGDRRDVQAECG